MTVKVFGIFEGKTRKYSPRVNNMKYSNTFSTIIKRFRFYPGKLGEKYCVFLGTQWGGDICVTMCLQLGDYYNQNAKRKPKIRENIVSPPVAAQGYTNVPPVACPGRHYTTQGTFLEKRCTSSGVQRTRSAKCATRTFKKQQSTSSYIALDATENE